METGHVDLFVRDSHSLNTILILRDLPASYAISLTAEWLMHGALGGLVVETIPTRHLEVVR